MNGNLISFLGSPMSGKTSLATTLFADLKRLGVSDVDFLPEKARFYIARKRREMISSGIYTPGQQVVLTDEDQVNIMRLQIEEQELMVSSGSVIITDTSPLNSLVYMGWEASGSNEVRALTDRSIAIPGTEVYNHLVPLRNGHLPDAKDNNRIHTLEQILEIDSKFRDSVCCYYPFSHKGNLTLRGYFPNRYRSLLIHLGDFLPQLRTLEILEARQGRGPYASRWARL